MRIEEPDFDTLVEAEVQVNHYSGDPEQWVIYEKNSDNAYVPAFLRYGESVIDPGKKLTIEVVLNGYLIRCGKESYVVSNDSWDLRRKVEDLTHKIVEKERDLTEEEMEELTTMTLKINTHFAAQSKR